MLNNLLSALSYAEKHPNTRTVATLLFTLFFSACSVTPDNLPSSNKELNPGTNKLYVDAVFEMKSGNTKSAQLLLTKVIQQQPDFSNAHVNLGILYIKMNMFEKAETSMQQALKISPDNIYALNQQGFLYRRKGDFSNAKASYEKAINIESGYANAHLNLGILYDLYLYNLEKAIKQYKIYNDLSKGNDQQVSKWIVDLERRQQNALSKK
ncbi:MAG: tetratricopeptide repeat protein [Gammaproteobacteria bacterium]|nr:tetratricopeptide repeat protein [Gammaproteobacteria bacterium]MCW8988824.1 tetratricopeptide repeat protein [Gammaproteobacteria bacterium]MCW9032522.1 tetratricopeptide repeat protein [Gammaproteobacteria bacterium]